MPVGFPKSRRAGHPVSYPALMISQNKHRFYFVTIPIDDLFPCCFVSRRDEDPMAGFQRALSESRAKDIAEYLASGTGSIPSNIVLSAQAAAGFTYTRKTKTVSFARVPQVFLVLDGQHRLWGYSKCTERHRVPVAIYENLSRAEEAKIFIDINTTQRGVPAALLLDIKQLAQIESTKETILRSLFDQLNKDPNSPLSGRLSTSKSVRGKISRVTFNRALGPVLSAGVLQGTDPPDRYRLILNYIRALDAEVADKKVLLQSTFFEALFSVFDEVIRTTIAVHKTAKIDAIRMAVRPIAQVDYSGQHTKTELVSAMQAALRQSIPISGEML
jgi:DGQHR domain-containing protein